MKVSTSLFLLLSHCSHSFVKIKNYHYYFICSFIDRKVYIILFVNIYIASAEEIVQRKDRRFDIRWSLLTSPYGQCYSVRLT